MALRKYELSKQILEENHYGVIGLDVYSYKRGERKLKPQIIGPNHKYGKSCEYVFYKLSLNGKLRYIGLHNIIYAWYKGEVPLGYEVDHLDGDTFNNSPENLELVTRAENIRRRPLQVNQYYYLHNHNEESWKKLHEAKLAKKAELAAKREAKKEARIAKEAEKSETLLVQGEVINSTLLLKTGKVVNDILVL